MQSGEPAGELLVQPTFGVPRSSLIGYTEAETQYRLSYRLIARYTSQENLSSLIPPAATRIAILVAPSVAFPVAQTAMTQAALSIAVPIALPVTGRVAVRVARPFTSSAAVPVDLTIAV